MHYQNMVALIVGGSSGIGLELARALSARRAQVYIAGRSDRRLQDALISLRSSGAVSPCAIQADVTDPEQAKRLVEDVLKDARRIDLLINSAGIQRAACFQDMPVEEFEQVMQVNYFGTLYVCKAVLPAMLYQRSGTIVNIGSVASRVSTRGYPAYAASKFALRGLTDAMRMDLKPHGIKVHIAYPSDTDTPGLAEENLNKPADLKYLSEHLFGVMSAEKVANAILQGVERGRYEITCDLGSKALLYLEGAMGGLRYKLLDGLFTWAERRAGQQDHGGQV